ncbi:hypothetical protein GCM10025868_19560 [Angustibacter aerolatus]|uniref:Uncharacterized protein n=1 Tax=Angustibacter aerolatus TaxID=1162965 RepID=A0ABQ6JIU1_9ACTN|nr:hypothetical protein [Angustibacter aerolatus]GMA86706.1 hypothetical protein GCM10025868_19560 [Angustibacter aerolatus]
MSLLDWLASLQRRRHGFEPVVATRPERPGWAWRAVLDGVLVATSGRTYQRQREAAYAYQQFAVHLPAAVVDDRLLQQVLRGRTRRRASGVR